MTLDRRRRRWLVVLAVTAVVAWQCYEIGRDRWLWGQTPAETEPWEELDVETVARPVELLPADALLIDDLLPPPEESAAADGTTDETAVEESVGTVAHGPFLVDWGEFRELRFSRSWPYLTKGDSLPRQIRLRDRRGRLLAYGDDVIMLSTDVVGVEKAGVWQIFDATGNATLPAGWRPYESFGGTVLAWRTRPRPPHATKSGIQLRSPKGLGLQVLFWRRSAPADESRVVTDQVVVPMTDQVAIGALPMDQELLLYGPAGGSVDLKRVRGMTQTPDGSVLLWSGGPDIQLVQADATGELLAARLTLNRLPPVADDRPDGMVIWHASDLDEPTFRVICNRPDLPTTWNAWRHPEAPIIGVRLEHETVVAWQTQDQLIAASIPHRTERPIFREDATVELPPDYRRGGESYFVDPSGIRHGTLPGRPTPRPLGPREPPAAETMVLYTWETDLEPLDRPEGLPADARYRESYRSHQDTPVLLLDGIPTVRFHRYQDAQDLSYLCDDTRILIGPVDGDIVHVWADRFLCVEQRDLYDLERHRDLGRYQSMTPRRADLLELVDQNGKRCFLDADGNWRRRPSTDGLPRQ